MPGSPPVAASSAPADRPAGLRGKLANREPVGVLVTDRLVETLIGVGIGLLAAVLTRDRAVPRRAGRRPSPPF